MLDLTELQREKLRKGVIYIGEKLVHTLIIFICLYVIFAADLPPHITQIMVKSLLGNGYDAVENSQIDAQFTSSTLTSPSLPVRNKIMSSVLETSNTRLKIKPTALVSMSNATLATNVG